MIYALLQGVSICTLILDVMPFAASATFLARIIALVRALQIIGVLGQHTCCCKASIDYAAVTQTHSCAYLFSGHCQFDKQVSRLCNGLLHNICCSTPPKNLVPQQCRCKSSQHLVALRCCSLTVASVHQAYDGPCISHATQALPLAYADS